MSEYARPLGDAVKRARGKENLTQNEVANAANIDVRTVMCILRPSTAAIPFWSGRFTERNGRFVTIDFLLL